MEPPVHDKQQTQKTEPVANQTSSNGASKAHSTQKSRSKSKKSATASGKGNTKWLSKEVHGNGGIRIRKVQIQGGKSHSNSSVVAQIAHMSKSAQGKMGGFNLLTSVKDRKN